MGDLIRAAGFCNIANSSRGEAGKKPPSRSNWGCGKNCRKNGPHGCSWIGFWKHHAGVGIGKGTANKNDEIPCAAKGCDNAAVHGAHVHPSGDHRTLAIVATCPDHNKGGDTRCFPCKPEYPLVRAPHIREAQMDDGGSTVIELYKGKMRRMK